MDSQAQQEVVAQLSRSAKYGRVCDETLERIAAWALDRSPRPADAVKRAKRKLHQVCGAFCTRRDLARAARLVAALTAGADPAELRAACAKAMALQESTRERLGILDELFARIFEIAGGPGSICDIGCGLNPLAVPWMDLPAGARYLALDIDSGLVGVVAEFFRLTRVAGEARCQDVLVRPVDEPCDVAFMMKLLTSLDQQRPGSGLELLRSTPCRHAVVSFPTRTLGGRDVGMETFYADRMREALASAGWEHESFVLGTELFFVIRRDG